MSHSFSIDWNPTNEWAYYWFEPYSLKCHANKAIDVIFNVLKVAWIHCWQRSTAGKYILLCSHNCKTPERWSNVSLVVLIIWQIFGGALSCDTTWQNQWPPIPGKQSKHFQYLGGLSAKGYDVHESRFILPLILWRWTPRTKGLEGKRKREYLNGTAKTKSTVNHAFQEKTYCVYVFWVMSQTWDLSRNLHDQNFGPKILHTKSA